METVSFTFGNGDDWEIFTIYVLMKNGDVYAICPFLPSKRYKLFFFFFLIFFYINVLIVFCYL